MTEEKVGRGGYRPGAGRKQMSGRIRQLNPSSLVKSTNLSPPQCGYLIHLQFKTDHHKNMVVPSRCYRWACSRCNDFNKQKWILHIYAMTGFDEAGQVSHRAFIFETSRAEWKSSVGKLLQKKHTDYARIRLNDGRLVVINNGGNGEQYLGDDFVSTLRKIFDAACCDCKPVSTSRRWQLGKEITSKWELVGNLRPKTEMEVEKILEDFGLPVKDFPHTEGISFKYPPNWTEDEIKNFNFKLSIAHNNESSSDGSG